MSKSVYVVWVVSAILLGTSGFMYFEGNFITSGVMFAIGLFSLASTIEIMN